MRHKTALIKAGEALGRVVEAIDMNMPSDIASIDINIAIDALGEITGETVSDDIVTAIFTAFAWVNSRVKLLENSQAKIKQFLRYLLEKDEKGI